MIIQSLYNTGEILFKGVKNDESVAYAHLYQYFDYEVLIDTNSDFINAHLIQKNDNMTLIPSTIKGEERSRNDKVPTPFTLHDTLMHVAGDYSLYYGKNNNEHISLYINQLSDWCNSGLANNYIIIILKYLKKGCLIKDMKNYIHNLNNKGKVRFAVKTAENEIYYPWKDSTLINDYAQFYHNVIHNRDRNAKDFCYVTSHHSIILDNAARSYIPNMGNAKLISKNDDKNYTYKGRLNANETVCVGKTTSFTINYALRWLVKHRSIKVGDINYIFYDQNMKTDWHIFSSTKTLLYKFDLDNKGLVNLEEKILDVIGDNNKLICFGIGALTPGRLNIHDYHEYEGKDINKIIYNIVIYHTYGVSKFSRFKYSLPNLLSVIEGLLGFEQKSHKKNSIHKSNIALVHDYIRIFLNCMLDGVPMPDFIINTSLKKIGSLTKDHSKDIYDMRLIINTICLFIERKIKMDEDNVSILYNEDTQILAGRLLAILHWHDYKLKYSLNKQRDSNVKLNVWSYSSLAIQYFEEFRINPYGTWIRLNLRLNDIENKLKKNDTNCLLYTNLKSKLESVLYNNAFSKLHNLDGRFLLGFNMQLNNFLSNIKKNITEDEKGENNEPERKN